MSPVQGFSPELARVTLFRVFLSSTLSHESTGSSAIEGLWGTLVRGRTVCEGKPGSEGWGGEAFYPLLEIPAGGFLSTQRRHLPDYEPAE